MAENDMSERVVLTPEGKKKLEDELYELKTVKRAEIAREIDEARRQGDLSENAEYDEAKNEQGRIEGHISTLEAMLNNAVVMDDSQTESDVVTVGRRVRVMDLEYNEEDIYTVVGATEADPSKLFVSTESPIGMALLNRHVGEEVEAITPGGPVKMQILEVYHK